MLSILIIVVCFFDLLVALLVPSTETMLFVTDGSAARYAVDFVALFIGLHVLYQEGWRKMPNIWLFGCLLFVIVSHFHAVNMHFEGAFIPKDLAIYDYKPMFEILLFFMMLVGVCNMRFEPKDIDKIKGLMSWICIAYAGFSMLQRLGLDQFYMIVDVQNIGHMSRNPEVGGFISQPVFCAAFMSILFPFVFMSKCWWKILIVIAGILATGNRSSLAVLCIAILYLIDLKFLAKLLIGAYALYLSLGIILYHYTTFTPLHEERFLIWGKIILDSFHSQCPGINNSHILTGIGIGAFPVLMPFYYKIWLQAHNEYLEAVKCIGIIGLLFSLMFAWRIPQSDKTMYAALIASFVLALTNATWHIPQLAFITVLLIGLLFNMESAYDNARTSCAGRSS